MPPRTRPAGRTAGRRSSGGRAGSGRSPARSAARGGRTATRLMSEVEEHLLAGRLRAEAEEQRAGERHGDQGVGGAGQGLGDGEAVEPGVQTDRAASVASAARPTSPLPCCQLPLFGLAGPAQRSRSGCRNRAMVGAGSDLAAAQRGRPPRSRDAGGVDRARPPRPRRQRLASHARRWRGAGGSHVGRQVGQGQGERDV